MDRMLIAFVIWLPAAAMAATSARTPESVWSRALEAGRTKIVAAAPKYVPVRMTIDRSSFYSAVITEPSQGINVDISRSGDSFWINGYLKANGHALDPRRTTAGASIMGGGVNVDMRPFGGSDYILSGLYKDANGKDGSLNVRFDVLGLPLRDMAVHEQGLDLYLNWRGGGYEITGKADPALYGKRELAILGAAVATVTWDAFGR